MMYTIIATCRLNDVDPLVWLTDVLTRIADISQNRLHELLPWTWKQMREQIDTLRLPDLPAAKTRSHRSKDSHTPVRSYLKKMLDACGPHRMRTLKATRAAQSCGARMGGGRHHRQQCPTSHGDLGRCRCSASKQSLGRLWIFGGAKRVYVTMPASISNPAAPAAFVHLVTTKPGLMMFTRMLRGASFLARSSEIEFTATLVAV